MKSYRKSAVALSAGVLLASAAHAQDYEDYARVRSVTPEYQQVSTPRDDCRAEYVPEERGLGRYVGPLVGGGAGALLGAQVGQGNGNRAATAVGAIAGAIIGDRVQNRYPDGGVREARRCRSSYYSENRLTGYRVAYEYGGRVYQTTLPYDPGNTLRVRVAVDPIDGGAGYTRTGSAW